MAHDPTTSALSAADEPLADFSECHAGITEKLRALSGLPALLEPAARAREIASDTLALFRGAVIEHHAEEERDLFPAVLSAADKGAERERVQAIIERLTSEHRSIEISWSRLEPALKAAAKGQDSKLDSAAVQRLVDTYLAHAGNEEQEFLPLAQTILGRNDNRMAALGIALHMRRTGPALMERVGFRA